MQLLHGGFGLCCYQSLTCQCDAVPGEALLWVRVCFWPVIFVHSKCNCDDNSLELRLTVHSDVRYDNRCIPTDDMGGEVSTWAGGARTWVERSETWQSRLWGSLGGSTGAASTVTQLAGA